MGQSLSLVLSCLAWVRYAEVQDAWRVLSGLGLSSIDSWVNVSCMVHKRIRYRWRKNIKEVGQVSNLSCCYDPEFGRTLRTCRFDGHVQTAPALSNILYRAE